ncbi:3-hydroxyisobutyrate dehydrogenase-like protein [Polyplosphaeria fusca]|uniref:3-hydroxyisobutyrate dehydrogenase n=1 Tax=Polyplosphaeria fusca TaxID=682080 RepID=A0A9P4QSD7_9PLEO|nr:3-hydroxyisobutyrate dehydrogenase-like protein [Polyplosphaeria fusca]
MSENYAFIGLGAMGYPMASNIRKQTPPSSTLYINDISATACSRFISEHASYGPIQTTSSARAAAQNAKVVISIVPGASDVKKVYLDPTDGVIAASPDPERLLCECSTIDVASTREVGEALMARGIGTYIDTPVSGGVPAAEHGDLSMLIGHSAPGESSRTSQRLSRVLGILGAPERFFYLGSLGAGLTAKIANNYLSGTIMLATAEALAIGVAQGLDPAALYSVIKASTGQSWMCDHVMPIPNVVPTVPSSGGYRPGFKTQMMIKDLGLGIESGRQVGVRPVMAEAAMGVWESASRDQRCVDRDGSSVYLHIGGRLPEGYEDTGRRREDGTWEFGDK